MWVVVLRGPNVRVSNRFFLGFLTIHDYLFIRLIFSPSRTHICSRSPRGTASGWSAKRIRNIGKRIGSKAGSVGLPSCS